jgi:hypothetical protein
MITAIYAILAAGLPALLKAISSKGANERIINIAAAVICMLAPILMANQEWDDHDRSKKTLARDDAKNYLESCAPMQFFSALVIMTLTHYGMHRK